MAASYFNSTSKKIIINTLNNAAVRKEGEKGRSVVSGAFVLHIDNGILVQLL